MTKKAITDNFPLTTYSGEKEELVIVFFVARGNSR